MALANMDLKTKNWSHVGEEKTVKRGKERRRGRGRRRREEEEEKIKRYGTMTFIMDSMRLCMTFHACMINSLSPKIMESKLGKTLNRTRNI